jgi:hypothetical protein
MSNEIKKLQKEEKPLLLITKIRAKGAMKTDTNQQDHPTASTISLANKKYLTGTLARNTSHLPENFLWINV